MVLRNERGSHCIPPPLLSSVSRHTTWQCSEHTPPGYVQGVMSLWGGTELQVWHEGWVDV